MTVFAPAVPGIRVAMAALVAAFLVAGCTGDDGSRGVEGPPGPPGPGTTSQAASLSFAVDSVTIASPPVVEFTLTNEDGVRFTGLAQGQIRFTLAKLVPGANGAPSALSWKPAWGAGWTPPTLSGRSQPLY